MIKNNILFNDDTVNIFTDASIKTIKGEHVGCAGFVTVIGDNVIEIDYRIIRKSTNNNSEINAIRLGVLEALNYQKKFKHINLFSDSKICIFGLREWIFNWINCVRDGTMYGSSGSPVSNQSVILDIVYTILSNELNINLYHQMGHVRSSDGSLLEAKNLFRSSNSIKNDVDIELIKNISYYNNMIDMYTRTELMEFINKYFEEYTLISPINIQYNKFDIKKYKSLLNIK